MLEIPVVLPSALETNLDRGGCYGTGAGKIGANDSILRIDSGYMTENSSYLITVVVEKHQRRAYFTQEVVISRGDPPEVIIRYDKLIGREFRYRFLECFFQCLQWP